MNNNFVIIPSNPDLQHHGILGMKWGVRRYQNYDGSYTQRGLKRYREHEAQYDSAKQRAKFAKESGNKIALRSAKSDMKSAKRGMKKTYRQLANDKKADKGKALYRQGKTITDNNAKRTLISFGIGSLAAGAINYTVQNGKTVSTKYGDIPVSMLIGAAAGAIDLGILAKYELDNQKIRAYYGHSSR